MSSTTGISVHFWNQGSMNRFRSSVATFLSGHTYSIFSNNPCNDYGVANIDGFLKMFFLSLSKLRACSWSFSCANTELWNNKNLKRFMSPHVVPISKFSLMVKSWSVIRNWLVLFLNFLLKTREKESSDWVEREMGGENQKGVARALNIETRARTPSVFFKYYALIIIILVYIDKCIISYAKSN